MSKPLDDYVEVSERITLFYEKHPEGSLRCKEIRTEKIGGDHFLVYVAQAFRTPDDHAPAEGAAWEPVPGKTNFTRDSELMNAETSAWGRAIAALGFEVKRGIASRQEVANRQNGDGEQGGGTQEATTKQKTAMTRAFNKAGVAEEYRKAIIKGIAGDPPSKAGASKILDVLFDDESDLTGEQRVDKLAEMAEAVPPSDVPTDLEGLPTVDEALEQGTTIGGDE